MNRYMILLVAIIAFAACDDKEDSDSGSIMNCSKSEASYTSGNGTALVLDTQTWYLEKNDIGGGSVNLIISGSISGDRATIRTYGDGIIDDVEIGLNANNEFYEDIGISFTATSIPEGDIVSNTTMLVYSPMDTLQVDLESCVLRY